MASTLTIPVFFLFVASTWALHTVNMTNNCGYGTPTLDQIPSITLATGSQSYTNGTVQAGAFLNTGYCGPNGGNCTTVDIAMNDTYSTVVVDLIPTHVFSVPVGFTYFNGCDGAGVSCLTADCVNAIRDPPETSGIVTCTASGASILVTFCPNLEPSSTSTQPTTPPSTTPALQSTSSTSSDSSRNVLVDGVVGGIVGALVICAALAAIFFVRKRRQKRAEKYAINEFTAPAPFFVQNAGSDSGSTKGTRKYDPFESRHSQQASTSSVIYSPTSHSLSHHSQYPPHPPMVVDEHPAAPLGTSPRARPQSQGPELDRIIEGLAERFGWTAQPRDRGSVVGEDQLPLYR